MVELVTIMIILGILAAVAIPRMNSAQSFRSVEFRDKTIAALRFAQKTATSHRRLVCVEFEAASVTLTINHDKIGYCDNHPLVIPGQSDNVVQSSDTSRGVFNQIPFPIYFQPDGRGTTDEEGKTNALIDAEIGGLSVYVAGATGYVGSKP